MINYTLSIAIMLLLISKGLLSTPLSSLSLFKALDLAKTYLASLSTPLSFFFSSDDSLSCFYRSPIIISVSLFLLKRYISTHVTPRTYMKIYIDLLLISKGVHSLSYSRFVALVLYSSDLPHLHGSRIGSSLAEA